MKMETKREKENLFLVFSSREVPISQEEYNELVEWKLQEIPKM